MAKSFKQPTGSPASAAGSPVSVGPDFFDMVAGAGRPAEKVPVEPAAEPTAEAVSPADVLPVVEQPSAVEPAAPRRKARPVGNTPLPEVPPCPPSPLGELLPPGPATRQTFVVDKHLLERLRDYVHARRSAGEYHYSQKQALDEALAEFLAAREPAPPRPEGAHAREQQFRERIQQGRQAGKAPPPPAESAQSSGG